ncbi:MAG: SIS domain-containing protein [Terracidiphilus sp.]|jgi:D-sedoheptulose 7-phosphate isomerase
MSNESMSHLIRKVLAEGIAVVQAVEHDIAISATLMRAAEATATAMKSGRKLMVAGNGGSAADAQHLVAEFVSRLLEDRSAMRAVALTTDTSVLTAIGNDYGYDRSFVRQVEALGLAGDVFLGISTSGHSPNVLAALERCREMGITTFGLTGGTGGKMPALCDYLITVPSNVTMYIQQAHLALEHIFCLLTEKYYFAADTATADSVAVARG